MRYYSNGPQEFGTTIIESAELEELVCAHPSARSKQRRECGRDPEVRGEILCKQKWHGSRKPCHKGE